MSSELTLSNSRAIMPVMGIEQAIARRSAIVEFTKQLMVSGTDFGIIPGTDKPTLLKPGAEKLTSLFGLSPRFEIVEKATDWTGEQHDGEPFFYFQYRCKLFYGEWVAGEGIGSCNSWEKKYRYRKAEPVCPQCGAMAIKKSKYPPRNNPQAVPGWYCYAKAGGCGAEFGAKDPAIIDQPRGDVPNPSVADGVNTVDKMAQKRALIAATLIAVNASEFFTQDMEDMDFGHIIDAEIIEHDPKPSPVSEPVKAQPKPAQPKPQPSATSGNGGKDWRKETLAAKTLNEFCNRAAFLLTDYNGEQHIKNALEGQPGFVYDRDNNAELLKWLEGRKQPTAATQAAAFADSISASGQYGEDD